MALSHSIDPEFRFLNYTKISMNKPTAAALFAGHLVKKTNGDELLDIILTNSCPTHSVPPTPTQRPLLFRKKISTPHNLFLFYTVFPLLLSFVIFQFISSVCITLRAFVDKLPLRTKGQTWGSQSRFTLTNSGVSGEKILI